MLGQRRRRWPNIKQAYGTSLWQFTLYATEYTQIGGDEALPLGEEFQEHIRCFVRSNEKKVIKQYRLADKIIEQLG